MDGDKIEISWQAVRKSLEQLTKCVAWEPLKKGDIVDVIAPASACKKSDLDRGLRFLQGWGLQPRVEEGIFGNDILCSHSDEVRFQHLKKAIKAKDSKVIYCIRGGYGSNRLLTSLSKMTPPATPKLLVGYSDITSLHFFLNQIWHWASLHGPVLESLGSGDLRLEDEGLLRKILFGQKQEVQIRGLMAMNDVAKKNGHIDACLVGGNLMVLQSFLGTSWQRNLKGQILFIEEINERGYRVDRAFWQMKEAGFLNGLQAVVFGDFVAGKEKDGRQIWKDVIQRFARESDIPILTGIPAGHGESKVPLPFMTPCRLELGALPRLTISSGVNVEKI